MRTSAFTRAKGVFLCCLDEQSPPNNDFLARVEVREFCDVPFEDWGIDLHTYVYIYCTIQNHIKKVYAYIKDVYYCDVYSNKHFIIIYNTDMIINIIK